jgi:DNA replication and repair protein RecF
MQVLSISVRDFRGYADACTRLGAGLTVLSGANGAGKTNLLEALYFGCTGCSCRTRNEREVVRFGASAARVVVRTADRAGEHELAVGFAPGQPKRMSLDGAGVERLLDVEQRPLVSVFLPDRLELVKGVPAVRRAHLDRFVSALWPARAATRHAYAQALAQRNALLVRIRSGHSGRQAIGAWDQQLAHAGVQLMADRRLALEAIASRFAGIARELGLDEEASIAYRPRSRAQHEEGLVGELRERLPADLERGFSTHGPHRDDVSISRGGRELRAYGSQGQQRLALLSLLLAEREILAERRGAAPLLLLDDVMSELDESRRAALIGLLRARGGQCLITTTDLEHVPGAHQGGVTRLAVEAGTVLEEALAP